MACYNELMELGSYPTGVYLKNWWRQQDNAATATVVDDSLIGADAALNAGTTDLTIDTGPNTWLPAAQTPGYNTRYPITSDDFEIGDNPFTISIIYKVDATSGGTYICRRVYQDGDGKSCFLQLQNGGLNFTVQGPAGYPTDTKRVQVSYSEFPCGNNQWHQIHCRRDGSSINIYADGTEIGSAAYDYSFTTDGTATAYWEWGKQSPPHSHCHLAFHSRALTDAECDEMDAGPELVNSIAPVVSGGGGVGLTASTTNGTWSLSSPYSGVTNGTPVYSYQWYRYTDTSGGGEELISGATNSTYTLVGADTGKYLRCLVRATNNGGYDPAEETFSNYSVATAAPAHINMEEYDVELSRSLTTTVELSRSITSTVELSRSQVFDVEA